MPQIIDVPGMGHVEFPDGMSDEQIASAIKANMPQEPGYLKSAWEGVKQGASDIGDTANMAWMNVAEKMGFKPDFSYKDYKSFRDNTRQQFDQSPEGKTFTGKASRFVTSALPYMAVPGGVAGGLATRMATGAAANAGLGLVSDIAENDPNLTNTKLGAGIGAIAPPLLTGASKLASPIFNYLMPKQKALSDISKAVDDIPAMIANKQAGQRVGINLTPAEASGNELLGVMQGNLGRSEPGAKLMQRFGKEHLDQQKSAISKFINEVSPDPASAASTIRQTAQQVIQGKEKTLSKKASPIYQEAYKVNIAPDQFEIAVKDPVISQSLSAIQKNPIYQTELAGVPQTSLRVLDLVKRDIDDQINVAMRAGEKNKARLLMGSKDKLVKIADEFSPDYQRAREIYGEGAKPLQALKESNVGRLSEMPDLQLKNVSKTIFDPAQTDPKTFVNLQRELSAQNPEAWRQITRNEMERVLDGTAGTATNVYNKILKSDRKYNQFYHAVKDIPGAQQKMQDMRATFNNIINPTSSRGAAKLSQTSMLGRRDAIKTVKDFASNLLGGKYDKAVIELITNPKWDEELSNFVKAPTRNVYDKAIKYTNILERVTMGQAAQDRNMETY
jgi:hypothetical protein